MLAQAGIGRDVSTELGLFDSSVMFNHNPVNVLTAIDELLHRRKEFSLSGAEAPPVCRPS